MWQSQDLLPICCEIQSSKKYRFWFACSYTYLDHIMGGGKGKIKFPPTYAFTSDIKISKIKWWGRTTSKLMEPHPFQHKFVKVPIDWNHTNKWTKKVVAQTFYSFFYLNFQWWLARFLWEEKKKKKSIFLL